MNDSVFPVNLCMKPINNASTVFIDSPSMREVYVIGSHVYSHEFPSTSAQIIELSTVATIF